MSWFSRKPQLFQSQQEAAEHMVMLLAAEGEIAGVPLSDREREVLAGSEAMPDELVAKARLLIGRVLDSQSQQEPDPRSFSNSTAWAADPAWPNIAEVTAQVITERNPDRRLRGWSF